MKEKVIIATKNRGKASEFASLFANYPVELMTLLDIDGAPDIEENGTTFEENAIIKAEGIRKLIDAIVIADDSGLMVDILDGMPGIYSARYAGEEKSDDANIDKLLKELEGVPLEKRTARFFCALAIAIPEQKTITVSGTCEGIILDEKRGNNGFGYDPIFYVPELGRTMAELTQEEKNKISHRTNALKKLVPIIEKLFND